MLLATLLAPTGNGSGSAAPARGSARRGRSARHVLSVVVSVGLHVGVPCIATQWVASEPPPGHRDVRWLEATLALEPASGDSMIRSDARGARERAMRPPPAPAMSRERPRAQPAARRLVSESRPEPPGDAATPAASVAPETSFVRAPANGRGSAAAGSPSQAQAGQGGSIPSSAAESTLGRANRAAAVARYVSSARERVVQHRHYPHLARRARLEGTVCLRVSITASGRVRDARVTCGGSQELLVRAALASVEAAAPFAPLPAELGPELTLELPVVFELAM